MAVILTDSDTTDHVELHAQGGEPAPFRNDRGAAGTIYLKTSNTAGTLLIDNNNYATTSTNWFTELPPTLNADVAALRDMTLDMRNQARVGLLEPNLHVRNLTVDATATLHLKGHDLYVHSFEPRNGLDGTVVEDGGRIIWSRRGTVFLVR